MPNLDDKQMIELTLYYWREQRRAYVWGNKPVTASLNVIDWNIRFFLAELDKVSAPSNKTLAGTERVA